MKKTKKSKQQAKKYKEIDVLLNFNVKEKVHFNESPHKKFVVNLITDNGK